MNIEKKIVVQREFYDPKRGTPVRVYNQNGFLLESGFLRDGMKHGTWYTYRENVNDLDTWLSLWKKESFLNGKREGISISYNRDQSEAGIALYRNDILIAGHGCAQGFD